MPHYLNDVLGMQRADSGWPLTDVMRRIEDAGEGAIVLLTQKDEQESVVKRMDCYQQEDEGDRERDDDAGAGYRTTGRDGGCHIQAECT